MVQSVFMKTDHASVPFATDAVRFICLRFSVRFSGMVCGSKLPRICVYILCDHPAISLGDRPVQSLQRPCGGDHMETAQSSCNLQTSTQKLHDAPAMSLLTPYNYLKSLQSFWGLSKILHCPNDQFGVHIRGSCDPLAMCLLAIQACDLQNLS